MTKESNFSGVLAPVLTPFDASFEVNISAFLKHCRWLLGSGLDGLAVFGTTSEANSLSVDEKADLIDALLDEGIPASKLMPGTGMCALKDTVQLTSHATARGCGGVLMLPPFYYKAVNDDGLYAAYSEVINRVGDAGLRVYLYHIPPVSQIPLSLPLIERLLKAYPETIVGIKDSSGDWDNTAAILRQFPDLQTFPGSEEFLLAALRAGGAGCITATANINPVGICDINRHWRSPPADALQARASTIRTTIQNYILIPALKTVAADCYGDPDWLNVRPPLVSLAPAERRSLMDQLTALGFSMTEHAVC